MSTLKTINIEHLDATSPSIEVNAAGGIQVGGALTATTGTFSGNVSVAGVLSYEDVTNIDSVGIITANAGIDISNTIVSNNDSTIRYDNSDFVIDVDSNNVRGSSKLKINIDTIIGLSIDDNRRVGIATDLSTSLAHPNMDDLQVGTHSGNRGITVVSGSSNYGSLCFGDSPDGSGTDRYAGFVEYYHQEDSMRLGTSGGEKLRITSSGTVVVGSGGTSRTGFFNVNSITPALQVETPGPSDNGRFSSIVSNAGSSAGYTPTLLFGKSRGTTVGSTDLLVSGDEIGAISFQGADGSQLVESARIVVTADGFTGADKMPGSISFQTTSDGAAAPDRKLEILRNGLVWNQASTSGTGNTDRGFYHGYSSPASQATGMTMKCLGIGGGAGPFDTGVSVNAGNAGGVALLFATRNTSAGTATDGAVYLMQFYYNGDNTPLVVHLGGDNWVTWGQTAGNNLEASWSGVSNYSFGMIMLQ